MNQENRSKQEKDTLVVLLHGFGDDNSTYEKTRRFLDSEGYLTYAPDLPGFGKSDLPAMLPGEMARVLSSCIVWKWGTGFDIHLIGHSLGGMVALFMTQNLGIRSVVMIEGTSSKHDMEFFESLKSSEPGCAKYSDFLQYMKERVDIAPSYRRYVDVLEKLKPETFDFVVKGVLSDFQKMERIIEKLEVPVAYFHGDKSRGGQEGAAFAEKIGWKTLFFPNSIHWLHEDSNALFVSILKDWLASTT